MAACAGGGGAEGAAGRPGQPPGTGRRVTFPATAHQPCWRGPGQRERQQRWRWRRQWPAASHGGGCPGQLGAGRPRGVRRRRRPGSRHGPRAGGVPCRPLPYTCPNPVIGTNHVSFSVTLQAMSTRCRPCLGGTGEVLATTSCNPTKQKQNCVQHCLRKNGLVQGAWRGTGAKGATASTQPSYAAKIGQATLPVGAAATAAAQQGVSLLARQPGSNPGGSNPVVVNGGSSLVAAATDNILGASTARTGSSTGPTTAGGSGLLMPGRRLLRGTPSPVK